MIKLIGFAIAAILAAGPAFADSQATSSASAWSGTKVVTDDNGQATTIQPFATFGMAAVARVAVGPVCQQVLDYFDKVLNGPQAFTLADDLLLEMHLLNEAYYRQGCPADAMINTLLRED